MKMAFGCWLNILIVDDDNHHPQSKKQHKDFSHQQTVVLDTAYLDAANTRPHHQFQTFKNQIPLLQHNITIWYSSTPILSKTSRPATLHNTNRTEPPCHANRNEPATDEPNRPYLRFPRTETNLNEPKPSCVLLCDVLFCDVLLCYVLLCDVLFCDVLLRGVLLCDVLLCDVSFCDVLLCGVLVCDVLLCDVLLCDVLLCDVLLCDVLFCDVLLCYVLL